MLPDTFTWQHTSKKINNNNKMAKQQGAFFGPLPKCIAETVHCQGPELSFDTFTKWLNAKKNVQNIQDIGRHTMVLAVGAKKKQVRPDRHKRKKLSQTYRKQLGLYTLGKKEVTYAQLLSIHELWKDYMRKLLDISELEKSGWNNSPEHASFELISLKLYRADFHGAHMTVIKSVCPSLVGCSGIVAIETKNCFKLVGRDDVCRTVPKKTCQFEFSLDSFKFTLYGHNFIVRPADRSSKKVKLIKVPCL